MFDALHLVESNGDAIVSSDDRCEDFAARFALKSLGKD